MTQEQINDNNKLIAEFMMGEKVVDGLNIPLMAYLDSKGDYHHEEDLHYHSSWDWLMPVVEKIESDGRTYQCVQQLHTVYFYDVKTKGTISFSCKETKLESTYEAVVKFIKWYNDNK